MARVLHLAINDEKNYIALYLANIKYNNNRISNISRFIFSLFHTSQYIMSDEIIKEYSSGYLCEIINTKQNEKIKWVKTNLCKKCNVCIVIYTHTCKDCNIELIKEKQQINIARPVEQNIGNRNCCINLLKFIIGWRSADD